LSSATGYRMAPVNGEASHILDGHDVVELFAEEPQRVTGARIANRHDGDGAVLHALECDVRAWITARNENPKPFVWTKTGEQILESLVRLMNSCATH
jgi:hypothetical protein